jgi:hypothetical protein
MTTTITTNKPFHIEKERVYEAYKAVRLLMGHSSLDTTARYLRIATSKVCATTSPLDLLPHPIPIDCKRTAPSPA